MEAVPAEVPRNTELPARTGHTSVREAAVHSQLHPGMNTVYTSKCEEMHSDLHTEQDSVRASKNEGGHPELCPSPHTGHTTMRDEVYPAASPVCPSSTQDPKCDARVVANAKG